MYPVYKCMESYPQPAPHQRNYIPYPYYYNPAWEVNPPHFKMDPASSPATSKPWPCYPNPTECHGCCNHSHPSCYYSFRPPHPYHLPHLPLYYYAYPPHHEAYPQYFVPPPHFPVEQAQCEYEKNTARNHSCGFPNHTCDDKAGGQVKIEEESPETGRKDCDSHGLIKSQNYPHPNHPIISMPPGYIMDRETAKPSDSDSKIWNGWIPLDLNDIRSLNKGEDEKRIKDQQIEDKKPQVQWPIIWVPGYDKPGEVEKEDIRDINASPNVAENIPSKFKIIPVKLLENENSGEKPVVAEDTTVNGPSSAVADKESKTKGTVAEKETTTRSAATEKQTKVKDIQVKQIEESGEKKSDNTAKKPSFPVKTSKLPPVCLRVDPLPKKKNGNATSRSPSPPAAKDRGHQNSTGQEPVVDKAIDGRSESKENKTINVEKPTQISNARKAQPKTKEIKVVNVEEKPSQTSDARVLPKQKDMQVVQVEEKMKPLQTGNDKQLQSIEAVTQVEKDVRIEDHAQCHARDPTYLSEEVSAMPLTNRVARGEREHETMEDGNEAAASKMEDKKKEMGKTLSDMEAAILIQSAYRGFEVRKWELLKKLSQIARIRKQVVDIREQLNDPESSAKLQDEKQRVMINETIMSLLLQLDTIQGLHPSIRESRKSVVRELAGLQEKLDSFSTQKTIEELPIERACRDETIQEDGSVLMESSPNPAEFMEPLINRDVASYASHLSEAVQTMASNEEEQLERLETKQNDVLELPAADAKSEQEEIGDHLTSVKSKASSISGEELMKVHSMNDGKHSSEEEEHVDSSISVNVEPASRAKEHTRDEEKHSAVNDKLVESMQIDETGDSTEENPSEAPPIDTQEKAASTLESVKDAPVEVLLESQTENEDLSMASGSPETCDECVDSVSEGDLPETNKASQIEVDEEESASNGKDEHDVERSAEPPSVTPKLPSMAVQEIAEYDPVKEEGSVEDEERQLHFSVSNIDAMAKLVAPKLTNEENGVEVSGASIMSDADAMLVMVGDPISEKMGEQSCQQRILEDFGIESSKETRVSSSSDICEAATHPQEAELIDQTPDAESTVEVQSSSDVYEVAALPLEVEAKSHPPYVTESLDAEVVSGIEASPSSTILESDSEQALNIASDSVPVSCGIDPVPSSEVELRKENRDFDGENERFKENRDLAGQNERLKEMLEKLLEAGTQQLTVISDLNGRVRNLERKLAKKRNMKIRRQKAVESSCMMQTGNMVNQRAQAASTA